MQATDVLRREHDLILQGLAALDAVARRIADAPPPHRSIETLLEFFERFADGCHHAKEEEMLFPAMIAAGLPAEEGPLAVMASEHGEGRRLLANLRTAVDDLDNDEGRRYFQQLVTAYVDLLAQHIEKENQFLFPIADELLVPITQHDLNAAFDDFEEERAFGAQDRWTQIVRAIGSDARRR